MIFESKKWNFEKIGVSMDGGSLSIYCVNKSKENLIIQLQQHLSSKYYEETSKIPGRIYIDETLIKMRSNEEKKVLNFLEHIISKNNNKQELKVLDQKISFIKSEKYINFKPEKIILSNTRKKYLKENED